MSRPQHEPEVKERNLNPRPKSDPKPEPKDLHLPPSIWKKPRYYGLTGSQLLDAFLYIWCVYLFALFFRP